MNQQALEARLRRLGNLIDGLGVELVQLGIDSDPFDKDERRQYMDGIAEAQTGLGKARNAWPKQRKGLGERSDTENRRRS